MLPPSTVADFLTLVQQSDIVDFPLVTARVEQLRADSRLPSEPKELARLLVREGILTPFQAGQLLQGKWRGFNVGKYRILERLGSGGMGVVYLGEHKFLHRRVAIKVLPFALAQDAWFLERFYHEAQAIAALDHPNIVRAHDVDQEGNLHFLVLEYVDGSSLQQIVSQHGPMAITRAAHYIRQAALGMQHAHEVGLVHRDIKPGNLLIDRRGVVKILDLGLAHFLRNEAKKDDVKRIVGTDDYLAPEQIVNSDAVDIRADIYSLGATFYFLLTGKPPFHDVTTDHHKLIWHVTRTPKPVRELRPEVPDELAAVIQRLMAKNPWERYQTPLEVVEALAPWAQTPIPPPPEAEMPCLSPAVQRGKSVPLTPVPASSGRPSGRGSWVLNGGTQEPASPSGLLSGKTPSQAQTPTATSLETQASKDPVKEVQPAKPLPKRPDQVPSRE